MLHAALLATAISGNPSAPSAAAKTAIQQCFGAMEGAVYHGDPSDRRLMKADIAACERAVAQIGRMRATSARGPEKLFLTARILDRAATLSYMGLGDAPTALREVRKASLYFRIAAGLANQSANYHDAAVANAQLTTIQLRTLHTDLAARRVPATTTAYTPYHKL